MTTHWRCVARFLPVLWPGVDCAAGGVYVHKAVSGDAGPAAAHTRETRHPTETSVRGWAAA